MRRPQKSAYRSPGDADQVRQWCRSVLSGWNVRHEGHLVDTSLGATHLTSLGSGDDVCVYLAGTNFNGATSLVVLEALATRFQVYGADLPGQPGLSAAARPGDQVSSYGQWLAEVVSWVQRRHPDARLVVAGHSRGAAVALSADPQHVEAVALLSPAGLLGVRLTPQLLWASLPWLVRRDVAGANRLLTFMSAPDRAPSADLVEWMTLVARTCRTTGAPGPYPDAVTRRWAGRKVCVVIGEHDPFFPVEPLRRVSLARLGVEPVVVQQAGHLLVDEAPEQLTNLIAELL